MVRMQLQLPESMPAPNEQGDVLVIHTLERYYNALLLPFEEAYRRNVLEQQRNRMHGGIRPPNMQGPPAMAPGASRMMDVPHPGQFPPVQATLRQPPNLLLSGAGPGMAAMNGAGHPTMNGAGMSKMQPGGFPGMPGPASNGSADVDHDMESRKRKMQEAAESDPKRARQKTGMFTCLC